MYDKEITKMTIEARKQIKEDIKEAAENITSLEYLEIFIAGYLKGIERMTANTKSYEMLKKEVLETNKEMREELEKLYKGGKNEKID